MTHVRHEGHEERFDLAWRIQPLPPTSLHLELSAYVDVPRFVPVGALGGQLAQGFAASRELDGSSPNASASSS
jgi:hypothetical protein